MVACVAALWIAALGAGVAQAGVLHEKIGEFGTVGGAPTGVAIDQSNQDIYVASNANSAVFKFNPKGEPINGAGLPSTEPLVSGVAGHLDIAVDNASDPESAHDLYVPDGSGHVVNKYTSAGVFVCELNVEGANACPGAAGHTTTAFNAGGESPEAVAVDPANGNVYVSDTGNNVVDVFSPSGAFIAGIAPSNSLPLQSPRDLRVDSLGNVYVATQGTSVPYAVVKFTPTGPTTWTESVLNEVGNATAIAVDSANDVYVAVNVLGVTEYGPAGEVLSSKVFGAEAGTAYGMAVNDTTGNVYVPGIGANTVFVYNAVSEFATTGPPENVTTTSATITGTVKPPAAGEATEIEFEWGPVGNVGEHKVAANVTSTNAEVKVHAELSGLEAETHYVYRLKATVEGKTVTGAEMPLTTLPLATVTTEPASVVKLKSATLNGKLKLNVAGEGEYHFEYGTASISEHSTTPTKFTGEATVSEPVASLEPGTKYHAQLVAVVEGHTITGGEVAFETPPPATATTEPATGVNAENGTLNGTPTLNLEVVGEGEYYFEYSVEGVGLPTKTTATKFTGTGKKSETVVLEPSTHYEYQLVVVAEGHEIRGGTERFETPPLATAATEAATNPAAESATLNGTVTLNVSKSTEVEYHFAYGKNEVEVSEDKAQKTPVVKRMGEGPIPVAASVTGLEPVTPYYYRLVAVVASSPVPSNIREVKTTVGTPAVSSESASHELRHSALLSGEVNPKNDETTYYFEYVEAQKYEETGKYNETTPPTLILNGEGHPAPLGNAPVPVGPVALSELRAGTVYHYRLVATNSGGGTKYGPDQTFETEEPQPPFVLSVSAQVTSQTSANLGAQVEPDGLPTNYVLEVGTELNNEGKPVYSTPTFGAVPEEGQLSFSLTGLLPATLYHFRVVVYNEDGTSIGADHTFTTPGFPPVILTPPPVQIVPTPPEPKPTPVGGETRGEKYTHAVKLCKRIKSKSKRAACMRKAKKKYGPVVKKKK